MKKFLSIILAAALIISLVPSVFAEGVEKNIIDYNFAGSEVGVTGSVYGAGNVTADKYEALNYKYIVYADYGNTHYLKNGIVARPKQGSTETAVSGTPFVLFRISVDKGGVYIPEFTYAPNEYGANARLYLLTPAEAEELEFTSIYTDKSKVRNILKEMISEEKGIKLGEVDTSLPVQESTDYPLCKGDWGKFAFDTTETAVFNEISLVKGDYYLFVNASSVPKFYQQDEETIRANLAWNDLKFTEILPVSIETSADKTIVAPNDTVTLTSVVTGDNGKEIDAVVTYTSSAPSVASVDAETGAVTAKAIGEATITATTSNGLTDTVNITVGKTTTYNFTGAALASELFNASNIGFAKDGSTDGSGYKYIKDGYAKWDNLNAYGSNSLKIYKTNFVFRIARGSEIKSGINGITYMISVPESGKYKIKYNYIENSLGLITGVWFADEKMLVEKNITTMAGTGSSTGCRLIMKNFEPEIVVDTYNTTYVADESNPSDGHEYVVSEETFNLAAGEYYVVLGVTGKNEKFDNSPTGGASGVTAEGAFSYMMYEGIDLIKIGEYVAPAAPTTPATTELYVYSPFEGAVTSDDIEVGHKLDVEVGTKITLSAKETVGDKVFVGWRNSSGALVSTKAEETFDIYTKTALMPIYDTKSDKPKVEFWNRSGNMISEVEVEAGTKFGDVEKPSASLNGFGEASGWSVSDDMEINGTVRAVAVYDYEDTGIEVSNVKVNGTAVEDATYNKKLELQESGATYWTRNAKTVAFGESFTHYIFNSSNGSAILAHKGAVTVRPVVTLDTNKDGYSMIEYDAADKQILEAGIIYGPEGVSLESYVTKASVKNLKNHGQFIALPNTDSSLDQSVARGYIVYLDESEYKVAYSD